MYTVPTDGRIVRTGDPSVLYAEASVDGTKVGPRRVKPEKADQTRAIRLLTQDMDSVVYAVRFPDGIVKIGCSSNFAQRLRCFRGKGGVVVGFMAGSLDDEQAIHSTLAQHRARGREYYHPTAAVMAVVNDMRDAFNLPHIAA